VGDRLKLSFSALSLYAGCPLKYRYLDVEEQVEPEVQPDWRRAPSGAERALSPAVDREIGLAIHRALARWQRAVDGGAAASAQSLLAAVAAETERQRLTPLDVDRAMGRLGPPLRDYAEGPWPRRRTLFLEQPVRHVLEDGPFNLELSLRVDRVVRYRRGVAILDFKTVPPHAFQARADEWQLRTYALAAPELLGLDSSKVALFILDLRNSSAIQVGNSPDDLAAARDQLLNCGRGIAAGDFALGDGHRDRPCWECGFRLGCTASLAPDPPVARHSGSDRIPPEDRLR
jgi:hypothetical protein